MTRNSTLFAATIASLLVANLSAQAQTGDLLAGLLQGSYINDGSPHNTNDWAELGSVVATFGNPGFNVQLNASNDNIEVPPLTTTTPPTVSGGVVTVLASTVKSDATDWKYGGDVFWRDHVGMIGFNGTAESTNADISTSVVTTTAIINGKTTVSPPVLSVTTTRQNVESVGMFGEFFVLPQLTLRGKGGWITGDYAGYYGDSSVVYYPYRQLAIGLSADYVRTEHTFGTKSATASLEYLPIPSMPFSLALQYTYAQNDGSTINSHGGENILGGVLRIYFGNRGSSLRDYQRNEVATWDATPPRLINANF
jgi:hypothetical protein